MVERIIVDATGMRLGKLAVAVARLLQGKDQPSFDPSRLSRRPVVVVNADRLDLPDRRLTKRYYRHSGYPGHLKVTTLRERKPRLKAVIREAVSGMLPKNRLRKLRLQQLTVLGGD